MIAVADPCALYQLSRWRQGLQRTRWLLINKLHSIYVWFSKSQNLQGHLFMRMKNKLQYQSSDSLGLHRRAELKSDLAIKSGDYVNMALKQECGKPGSHVDSDLRERFQTSEYPYFPSILTSRSRYNTRTLKLGMKAEKGDAISSWLNQGGHTDTSVKAHVGIRHPKFQSPDIKSRPHASIWRGAARFLVTIIGKEGGQLRLPMKEEHWLEALDLRHRAGGDLKGYYQEWIDSETNKGFFDWLDHSDEAQKDLPTCARRKLDSSCVKYCTTVERQTYLVEVIAGVLRYKMSSELVHGKKMIFVMGVEGHLYMSAKVSGHFHHSSFLAGNPVLVAGTAHLEKGCFTKLMPYSGHYRPEKAHFDEFVPRMRKKGLAEEQCAFLFGEINDAHFFDKSIRGK